VLFPDLAPKGLTRSADDDQRYRRVGHGMGSSPPFESGDTIPISLSLGSDLVL